MEHLSLARFIKNIGQLKSDIRSCRCKNFSLKQGLMGGGEGGSGPRDPTPGSATVYYNLLYSPIKKNIFKLQNAQLILAGLHLLIIAITK